MGGIFSGTWLRRRGWVVLSRLIILDVCCVDEFAASTPCANRCGTERHSLLPDRGTISRSMILQSASRATDRATGDAPFESSLLNALSEMVPLAGLTPLRRSIYLQTHAA